ncbi:MFS general substrate transporter [Mollisia scopiformis]|uniref:MFS general substrate transporter n=1 Tax=Mollisia scopiformis TaxID=149040 RepID=A0A194X7U1_MOLSC|nr:MFS general substrate transporter [Mollisia scopiformis]KUJ16169.1 MFS general substrate transporter [Mollisia scopiformis]
MVDEDVSHNRSSRFQEDINEETSFLSTSSQDESSYGTVSSNTTLQDDESDDNEAEFENYLARAQTIGHGTEAEAQVGASLRNPRKYRFLPRIPLALNYGTVSTNGSHSRPTSIDEETETEEEADPKSRYLGGVSKPQFWLIFASLTISYFVSCFDGTIMVSSHPVITSYFQSANSASWLSTSFLLTSTAIQPLFGRLSDAVGRKYPYIGTVAIFLVGTIWCASARNITSFILARGFCGIGAGGMMAIGAIIISDLVPIEIRGAYQSYMNIVFGAGAASGAALGGAIADNLGWQWEFWIQLPFLVVCLCLAIWTIPNELGTVESQEKRLWEVMKSFDYMGSALLTTAITFSILGLNLGGNIFNWTHPFILSCFTIATISFPAFILIETKAKLPIMPINLIKHNPRAGLILSNTIAAMAINAITFNLPLYFQAVLLETATTSGLRLIIPTLVASLIGAATGFLITWTKKLKWLLVTGNIFLLLGGIVLSVMHRGLPPWLYILCIVPSSIGQGFMMPATFMAVLVASEQVEQAVVTSTLMLWRSLGFILGVAMSSLVLQNALISNLEQNVTGADKESIIRQVRESVQAISGLEPVAREQVINAYSASLRATFILAAVLGAVAVLITIPLKVPRLGYRKG